MEKIKLLKDTEFKNEFKKKGDMINCSKKDAELLIQFGIGESAEVTSTPQKDIDKNIEELARLRPIDRDKKIEELSEELEVKPTVLKEEVREFLKRLEEERKGQKKEKLKLEGQRKAQAKWEAEDNKLIERDKAEQKKAIMDEEGLKIFGKESQISYFLKKQPIFYDKSGMWWVWDNENTFWDYVDDIEILNSIKKVNDRVDIISSKERTEIINALKQEGRKIAPKEPGDYWVQYKDKIVDVKSKEVFDSTPEYFMVNPIPWEIGESEDTPTFDKYFREWVVAEGIQDESYIDTLYEIIAYSTMGKQFLQRLFAFVGSGSNGKGVYLSIIKKFLGENNICSTELKILSDNIFEASALYKKQACFMGEVDAYDMKNTSLLKKLSGEDDIRYGFKGKTPFTEKSNTTNLMNTNSLPVSPDKSKGFYRRWMIVDFPHEFPVGKDILAEIPDIEFNNLAKKCIRICGELLKKKEFTNEGDLDMRIKRYEDRSNPLMRFIEDNCEEDINRFISLQQFSKVFNDYLKENRLRIMSVNRISKALKEEGFDIYKREFTLGSTTIKTNCLIGIGINSRGGNNGN